MSDPGNKKIRQIMKLRCHVQIATAIVNSCKAKEQKDSAWDKDYLITWSFHVIVSQLVVAISGIFKK